MEPTPAGRRSESLNAEAAFIKFLQVSEDTGIEFEKISKSIRDAVDQFSNAQATLSTVESPPSELGTFLGCLTNICTLGNELVEMCTQYITLTEQNATIAKKIWDSNVIKKEDIDTLEGLCRAISALLTKVCEKIGKLQEQLNGSIKSHDGVMAWNAKENELQESAGRSALMTGIKWFGAGLLIFAACGLAIVTAGAGVGVAVATVAGVAGAWTGASIGAAGLIAAGFSIGYKALTGYHEERQQIQQTEESKKLVKDRINEIKESLERIRQIMDGLKYMQDVSKLSEAGKENISKIIYRVKERMKQQEEANEAAKLRLELGLRDQELQKENKEKEELLLELQKEKEKAASLKQELEKLQKLHSGKNTK